MELLLKITHATEQQKMSERKIESTHQLFPAKLGCHLLNQFIWFLLEAHIARYKI